MGVKRLANKTGNTQHTAPTIFKLFQEKCHINYSTFQFLSTMEQSVLSKENEAIHGKERENIRKVVMAPRITL